MLYWANHKCAWVIQGNVAGHRIWTNNCSFPWKTWAISVMEFHAHYMHQTNCVFCAQVLLLCCHHLWSFDFQPDDWKLYVQMVHFVYLELEFPVKLFLTDTHLNACGSHLKNPFWVACSRKLVSMWLGSIVLASTWFLVSQTSG